MMQSRSPDTTLMGPDPAMARGLFRDHHYGFKSSETACDSYLQRSISASTPISLVSVNEYMDSLSQVHNNIQPYNYYFNLVLNIHPHYSH